MPHVLSVGCGLECLLHPNRLQQFVAAVIRTTSNHLFWEPYLDYGWISADHLKPGMQLKTPDGQSAVVVGGSVPAAHDGWMWDSFTTAASTMSSTAAPKAE